MSNRKKPTSKAGLTREVNRLTAELAKAEETSAHNFKVAGDWKTKAGDRLEQLAKIEDRLQTAKIEAAELHGYINRIEVEDDADWHDKHGVRIFREDNTGTAHQVGNQPPLRQRLRGARYETPVANDIYHMGHGRPSRHGGG